MSLFIFLQRPPQSFLTNLERGEESKGAQRDDASSGGKTCMDQLVMWKWDKRGRPLRIIQKKTRSCKYMQLWCDRKLHWFLEFFYIKAHVRIQHICTFTQCIVYISLAVELKSKSFFNRCTKLNFLSTCTSYLPAFWRHIHHSDFWEKAVESRGVWHSCWWPLSRCGN